jgi:hypothetical protein
MRPAPPPSWVVGWACSLSTCFAYRDCSQPSRSNDVRPAQHRNAVAERDWKVRSRFVRFYRAKNRCEWCGAANRVPHPVTWGLVVLTVAHVFDERPEAASLLNLAALCQRRHNRQDGPRRQRLRARRGAESGQTLLGLSGAANEHEITRICNDECWTEYGPMELSPLRLYPGLWRQRSWSLRCEQKHPDPRAKAGRWTLQKQHWFRSFPMQ